MIMSEPEARGPEEYEFSATTTAALPQPIMRVMKPSQASICDLRRTRWAGGPARCRRGRRSRSGCRGRGRCRPRCRRARRRCDCRRSIAAPAGRFLVLLRQQAGTKERRLIVMLASGCLAFILGSSSSAHVLLGAALHFPGIVARQGAIAPVECALAGQDVGRGAAGNDADIYGGVAGHGVDVGALALRQLDLQFVQPMDEVAGEVDGADRQDGSSRNGPRRR